MFRKQTAIAIAVAAAVGLVVSLSASAGPATAATGNQGYAVYRDGVVGFEWHTGLMDDPHYNTTTLPVTHHPGSGTVTFGTWAKFLDGNTYKGVYRPKTAPSSSARDSFVSMGRKLINEDIPYNLGYQVMYDTGTAGTYVDPIEIKSIRCDGVIEYVYEWYNYKVYGGDWWDVTKNDYVTRELHSGFGVTPKIQASSYLTKVSSSLP